MKKSSIIISLITLMVTTAFAAALALQTIYQADGVSEPVTITLESAIEVDDTSGVQVTRLSRGGAQFGVATTSKTSWTTSEWVRDIIITYPNALHEAGVSWRIVVGSTEYFVNDEPTLSTTSDTAVHTITKATLERQSILMPFFGRILNWPGDATAIFRAIGLNLLLIIGCAVATTLTLLGYRHLVTRPYALPKETELQRYLRTLVALCALFLSVFSIALFVANGPTASTWPAFDMAPYFERAQNPDFLVNDFYTNVSSEPNPRIIFGSLITGVADLFGATWYQVFFGFRVAFVTLLPPLIFLALLSFFRNFTTEARLKATIGITIGVALALIPLFIDQFTIALWQPYETQVTPQVLSFFLGIGAMYLCNYGWRFLGLISWFVASLIHPAIGLSLVIFYCLAAWQILRSKLLLVALAGTVLPFAILHLLFAAENPLSTADFVYYYITVTHAFHYVPSMFESSPLSPLPWYFHFIFVSLLLGGLTACGWWYRQRWVAISGMLALLSYTGAVAISYLFVELWPIKIFAVLGPSRYTFVGYWFIVLLGAALLTLVPMRYFIPQALIGLAKIFDVRTLPVIVLVIIGLLGIGVATNHQDDPLSAWRANNQSLVTWIADTDADAVFAADTNRGFEYLVHIPLVSERSVFSGNGFPFREDDFAEFDARRELLYGEPNDWQALEGASIQINSNTYFRSLTPSDLSRISEEYRLDYVIIEPMFSEAFQEYSPVFTDDNIYIYSVNDFAPDTDL